MKIQQIFFTFLSITCFSFLPNVRAKAANLDSLLSITQLEKDPYKKADNQLNYLTMLFSLKGDSASALLDQLILTYEKEGFSYGFARALSLKSWLLDFSARYEDALKSAHRALAIQMALRDSPGIALTLNRIGLANVYFGRYDHGIKYMNRALAYFLILNDSVRIDGVLNNLGVNESARGRYPEAIYYYRQSLKIRQARKDHFWTAYAYYNIAAAYLNARQTDSAKYYFLLSYRTFSEKTANHKVPAMVNLGMGELYQELGDYPKALSYINTALKQGQETSHTELIISGKLLLSDLLFKTGKYKDAFITQREFLDLKNVFDSTNSSERVAEVEEKYKNAEKEEEIIRLKTENLESENRSQQFRLQALLAIVLLVILVSIIIIYFIRKAQKQKIRQSDLNVKIAEAKLFALRAQMNPHFIFNSINTAQGFIVGDQKEQAHEYISNFAKLLRMVMENSAKTFVPLEDEVTQLEVYIGLEAIRFDNKFNYTLLIDPRLQDGVYEVPGMIIQPFIENAIGHGLINRDDQNGKLIIKLDLAGDFICCEVTDNGVGRQKAAEIKAGKNTRYSSAAIPNIRERLELLQHQTITRVSVEITDLVENGDAAGTKVTLMLPFR